MWDIVNEIKKQGTMNGNQVSKYSRFTLLKNKKSAGGCLARAIQYGYIKIVGTTYVNGKQYNIYA